MALDKNKILNELGSVVNQLQSADCGCMGKLFSGSNPGCDTRMHPGSMSFAGHGGCRGAGGCCHGYNYGGQGHNALEGQGHGGYGQMQPYGSTGGHCMGSCNPPKLYADTYNYLNHNLMKPVVQEVYQDLKSITPDNTIANNPMAAQMFGKGTLNAPQGASNTGQLMAMGDAQNFVSGGKMANNLPMDQMQGHQTPMGGMGPDIVNMIMSGGGNKKFPPSGKLTESMIIDAPQSPHGQIGITPLSGSEAQSVQPNMTHATGNMGQLQYNVNAQQHNMVGNPGQATQNNPMTTPTNMNTSHTQPNYGGHEQGMKKFNQMFPGVLPKELGFDPMAIAIQMNPANHHSTAMNSMKSLMMGDTQHTKVPQMQPQIVGSQQMPIAGQQQAVSPNIQHSPVPGQEKYQEASDSGNVGGPQPVQRLQTQYPPAGEKILQGQGNSPVTTTPAVAHQVYSVGGTQPPFQPTGAAKHQLIHGPPIIPGEDTVNNPGYILEQPSTTTNALKSLKPIDEKEPLMPVDTSHSVPYGYNTLGQRVEFLPADVYHPPVENLPQTLSPQPVTRQYSNVKNTVSKTSLMGNRPVARQTSRSQLQHIYHQYKGSHSLTQQNISGQAASRSDGRLNLAHTTQNQNHHNIPLERQAGDMMANNASGVPEAELNKVGDINDNAKMSGGDTSRPKDMNQDKSTKGRNGLQDQTFSAYYGSAAWSFHGNKDFSPRMARNH